MVQEKGLVLTGWKRLQSAKPGHTGSTPADPIHVRYSGSSVPLLDEVVTVCALLGLSASISFMPGTPGALNIATMALRVSNCGLTIGGAERGSGEC